MRCAGSAQIAFSYNFASLPNQLMGIVHNILSDTCPCPIYVTVFAKRDHLGANLDFEFCLQRESTVDELPDALYCASLAGLVSEIRRLKVRNYEHSVFKKTAFNHLLPVNSAFCRITNDVIANMAEQVLATGLARRRKRRTRLCRSLYLRQVR